MRNCILLTHQWILNNSEKAWKRHVFDFCVTHYRRHNPDTYIMITGHGEKPLDSTLDLADWYYWQPELIQGDMNKGHPILVTNGLNHAKEMNIENVCKTRIDTINMIPNIADHCHKTLERSGKSILNTHYYKNNYSLMDLFMYSSVDDQLKLFNPKKWEVSWINDGTGPVARNYIEDINNEEVKLPFDLNFWEQSLNKNILFLNPTQLKWLDFRKHRDSLRSISSDLMDMDHNFDKFKRYVWVH